MNEKHLHVNKSLNSICSSYKAIVSLQRIWTKRLNSYGIVLQSIYELIKAPGRTEIEIYKVSLKYLHYCISKMNEIKSYIVRNDRRVWPNFYFWVD